MKKYSIFGFICGIIISVLCFYLNGNVQKSQENEIVGNHSKWESFSVLQEDDFILFNSFSNRIEVNLDKEKIPQKIKYVLFSYCKNEKCKTDSITFVFETNEKKFSCMIEK